MLKLSAFHRINQLNYTNAQIIIIFATLRVLLLNRATHK